MRARSEIANGVCLRSLLRRDDVSGIWIVFFLYGAHEKQSKGCYRRIKETMIQEVSTQEHTVDALPQSGDEGRGYLRKATGSRKHTLIRGCPNGATQLESCPVIRKEANPEN